MFPSGINSKCKHVSAHRMKNFIFINCVCKEIISVLFSEMTRNWSKIYSWINKTNIESYIVYIYKFKARHIWVKESWGVKN